MELGPQFRLIQETRLSQKQKLALRKLRKLETALRSPEFPEAARGFDGMVSGDDVLRKHGAVGILIGGLAREIWNKNVKPEALAAHKDVDIMIVRPGTSTPEDFEEGVDWWLPRHEDVPRENISTPLRRTYWKNGNNVRLLFGVVYGRGTDPRGALAPGLYLIEPDLYAQMKRAEIENKVGDEGTDPEVLEKYEETIRDSMERKINSQAGKYADALPGFLGERFGSKILNENRWGSDHIRIENI